MMLSRHWLDLNGKNKKRLPFYAESAFAAATGESWTDRNLFYVCEWEIFKAVSVNDPADRHVMVVGTSAVPGDPDSFVSVQRRIQAGPAFSGNISRNAIFRNAVDG